jgi:ABC-2 type transport system permease protein
MKAATGTGQRPVGCGLSITETLEGYGALLVRSLKAAFAYRATTLMSFVTSFFTASIIWMVWWHVYENGASADAPPPEKLFPYLLLAFCLNYVMSVNSEFRVAQRIRMGLIATDLLKPVDFQTAQLMQSVSDSLFNACLMTPVFLGGWALLGNSMAPASSASLGFFAASVVLGFLVQFGVVFFFVQGIFFTLNNYGIQVARGALHAAFSGLSAPLVMYPPLLRRVGEALPFQYILYKPVLLYQGAISGGGAWLTLGRQALWAAGLFLAGRWLFSRIVRSLEVQGG